MSTVMDVPPPAARGDELDPGRSGEIRLMEHLASLATRTESEAEAEAFLGALAPLAARLVPAATRAVPALAKAAVAAGQRLWRSPAARPYVRALPHVVRRTAADVARTYARGAPVTPDVVARRFAQHTSSILRRPDVRRAVLRRARAADKAWHADARRVTAQAGRTKPGGHAVAAGARDVVIDGQRWCRC